MSNEINSANNGGNDTPETTEKTFTQADVNRIVQERLRTEKAKTEADASQREAELNRREFLIEARETIAKKGLSVDILDALNTSTPEAFSRALELIEPKIRSGSLPQESNPVRVDTGAAHGTPLGAGGDGIRRAMGLE